MPSPVGAGTVGVRGQRRGTQVHRGVRFGGGSSISRDAAIGASTAFYEPYSGGFRELTDNPDYVDYIQGDGSFREGYFGDVSGWELSGGRVKIEGAGPSNYFPGVASAAFGVEIVDRGEGRLSPVTHEFEGTMVGSYYEPDSWVPAVDDFHSDPVPVAPIEGGPTSIENTVRIESDGTGTSFLVVNGNAEGSDTVKNVDGYGGNLLMRFEQPEDGFWIVSEFAVYEGSELPSEVRAYFNKKYA